MDDGSPAGKPTADTFDGEHDELDHASDDELENSRVIGFPHWGPIKHVMCHGDRGPVHEECASRAAIALGAPDRHAHVCAVLGGLCDEERVTDARVAA